MLPCFLQLAREEGESSVCGVRRIVEGGRDLLGLSGLAPMLKRVAQSNSEDLCRQETPQPLWATCCSTGALFLPRVLKVKLNSVCCGLLVCIIT